MPQENSNVSGETNRLSLNHLPRKLRNSIIETLGCAVVPLWVGYRDDDGLNLSWEHGGSGLLAEVDGVSGILTAEHVIFRQGGLKEASVLATVPRVYPVEDVGVSSADHQIYHTTGTNIRVDLLNWYPATPSRPDYNDPGAKWGPDLGFIRIPKGTNFESNLRATRINFYSWARRPAEDTQKALKQSNSMLAVAGAPLEWITDNPSPGPRQIGREIQVAVLATAQERYWVDEHNGYDFIDALVEPGPGTVIPESFRGVSGGPLWRFRDPFQVNQSFDELKHGDYVLAGVVFWEDYDPQHGVFVRAHGPRSIYEKFLPEVRDWLRRRTGVES
jgi:hypothetical protein